MDFVWRNTEIRNYMNTVMYERAFSETEKLAILDTEVTSTFKYKEEKDVTVDKLFILSYDELVNDYGFTNKESLMCKATDFGRGSGTKKYITFSGEQYRDGYGAYCTLTEGYKSENPYAGDDDEYAFCTAKINAVSDTGEFTKVDALNCSGIRVAMWVNLSKCEYKYAGTVSSNGDVNEVAYTTPIKLTRAKISSVKNRKKRTIRVKYKKVNNAKKYRIQYATNKKFKKAKTKTSKKTTVKIKKVKLGKTYYVRVRAVNGNKLGKWSKVKKVKITK